MFASVGMGTHIVTCNCQTRSVAITTVHIIVCALQNFDTVVGLPDTHSPSLPASQSHRYTETIETLQLWRSRKSLTLSGRSYLLPRAEVTGDCLVLCVTCADNPGASHPTL